MKFTDGYWNMKPQIEPLYAVEYVDHAWDGEELTIYTTGRHVEKRGDILNQGTLTVRINSPLDDIIRVEVTHFEGIRKRGPYIEVGVESPKVSLEETDTTLVFHTGKTKVVINKQPNQWGLDFYDGDRWLTGTGWRNMAYMTDTVTDKHYMLDQLSIDIDEYIYGLGERFTPFIKNGQQITMWNEDGGTASEIAYKNIPFYITNKGYGVLVDSLADVDFEIASEKVERIQFSLEGESLAYYVVNGSTPKETLVKYTDLTGKPALPPAWSFGLWLTTSFTTDYDEETTSRFINGMADRDIPLHVFHFDCFWMKGYEWCNFTWDPDTFSDPKGMLERYHDKGLKICVWINPYIAQKSRLFKEGMDNGYLVETVDGNVWQTDKWQAGMGLVDFTNPEAIAWYQQELRKLLHMGVDCFKTDFGERIPVRGIRYYDESDPLKMHHYYTYLYNKAVFDLLEEERGKNEAVLFARSATVGSQKFPVHWGGDCSATYPSMAESLRGGLSLALAGFGYWSHDISGFEQTATADVYKRWCAFGMLSTHSRLHGSSSYRVPWMFDDEATDVLREFTQLKCQLMPYLYAQAVIAHETGIPMMRPLFLDYPADKGCEPVDKQYMLGDRLMVAPVFKSSGDVDYYLPEGQWVGLLDRKAYEGGRWLSENHDYHSLPLMVPYNRILPMGQESTKPDYDYTEGLTLYLTPFEDGQHNEVTIVNIDGTVAGRIQAHCTGDTLELIISGDIGEIGWEWLLRDYDGPEVIIRKDKK